MRLKWISLSIILFLISNILVAQSSNLNEKIQSFYLPQNGLKVILKEQRSMPMVGMSLFYNVGSHDEPAGVKGMTKLQAHLFEESGYEDVKEEISLFCKYVGISNEKFYLIAEKFRNKEIWKKNNNIWELDNFIIKEWDWEK